MKDRKALAVISQAEADGRLKRGNTVVEYTGGSTGASLALVCAAKGSRTGYYPMGEEIWRQTEEKVDAFVQSVGTAALSRGGGGPEATQARDPPWRRAWSRSWSIPGLKYRVPLRPAPGVPRAS
jgi:hypothetical protein